MVVRDWRAQLLNAHGLHLIIIENQRARDGSDRHSMLAVRTRIFFQPRALRCYRSVSTLPPLPPREEWKSLFPSSQNQGRVFLQNEQTADRIAEGILTGPDGREYEGEPKVIIESFPGSTKRAQNVQFKVLLMFAYRSGCFNTQFDKTSSLKGEKDHCTGRRRSVQRLC